VQSRSKVADMFLRKALSITVILDMIATFARFSHNSQMKELVTGRFPGSLAKGEVVGVIL
jgi:hypothetical protein